MRRLPLLVTVLALACLVAAGCKTTGTPTTSQQQGGQSAAQPSGHSAAQSAAQSQAQQPTAQPETQPTAQAQSQPTAQARPIALALPKIRLQTPAFAQRAARRITAAPLVIKALSAFHRMDLGKIKVKLFGANLPASDLIAPIVACVLLLGGGYWVFASRRLARQGR